MFEVVDARTIPATEVVERVQRGDNDFAVDQQTFDQQQERRRRDERSGPDAHVANCFVIVRSHDDGAEHFVGSMVEFKPEDIAQEQRAYASHLRKLGFNFFDDRQPEDSQLMPRLVGRHVPIASRIHRPPCRGLNGLDDFLRLTATVHDLIDGVAPDRVSTEQAP